MAEEAKESVVSPLKGKGEGDKLDTIKNVAEAKKSDKDVEMSGAEKDAETSVADKEDVESSDKKDEKEGKTDDSDVKEAEVDSGKGEPKETETVEGKKESKEGEGSKEADEKEVDPHKELARIIKDGTDSLFIKKDPAEAAESLGLACEKARELHGEMGDECAEVFFLYGCAMLECSKILENTVFGEKGPKEEESEEEDGEEEDGGDDEPIMLTKKTSLALRKLEEEKAAEEAKVGEDTAEETEEEDNMLRAAWEMFELSKIIYQKQNKEDKVAETYMKLGEVSVESGNVAAVDDMKSALEIRKRIYPEGDRIIPETYFHIGLAYSYFEMFDEAIDQFRTSRKLLDDRIASLEKLETEKADKEVKEIQTLLPEIDDKISDMVGSKEEKSKAQKVKMNGEGTSASPQKEATNITHLVKRKRKLDDVAVDLNSAPNKQACLEQEAGKLKKDQNETGK